MLIKKITDHNVIQTSTCGEIREILRAGELESYDLALAINIQPTKPHYHSKFTETYFVLDGELTLQTFDPASAKCSEHVLRANELAVIVPGIHHRITSASPTNRLCVISSPQWMSSDEHLSDVL